MKLLDIVVEDAVIPALAAKRLPDGVDFEVVTGLNYAYGTTLYGLKYRGELQPGETMLVTGAGGFAGLVEIDHDPDGAEGVAI